MMFVTNDIFKQFAIGCVADLGKILLVSGQITIAFESMQQHQCHIECLIWQGNLGSPKGNLGIAQV